MKYVNLKENTPNLNKMARDSRSGTVPVSLKVKNKIYAILEKVAEENGTSVGAIINELLNNYIEFDSNFLYNTDEEEIARQLVKNRMRRLGKRLYDFNDIELSAFICEQSKKGIIDQSPFIEPLDVDKYISNSEEFDEIYLNTTSAPNISLGKEAYFDPNYGSMNEANLSFPIYCLIIKAEYAKLVLPLLFAYVDDYNKYIKHEEYSEVPCISEKKFRKLVDIMNGPFNKKQMIDNIVEVLVDE